MSPELIDISEWRWRLCLLADQLRLLEFMNVHLIFLCASQIASDGQGNPHLIKILSEKSEYDFVLEGTIPEARSCFDDSFEESKLDESPRKEGSFVKSSSNLSFNMGACLSLANRILYLQENLKFEECQNLIQWLQFNFFRFTKPKHFMLLAKAMKEINPICSFIFAICALVNGTEQTSRDLDSSNFNALSPTSRKRHYDQVEEIFSSNEFQNDPNSPCSFSIEHVPSPAPLPPYENGEQLDSLSLNRIDQQKISSHILNLSCEIYRSNNNQNVGNSYSRGDKSSHLNETIEKDVIGEFPFLFEKVPSEFPLSSSSFLKQPQSLISLCCKAVADLIFIQKQTQWNQCVSMFLSIPAPHLQHQIMFDLSLLFCGTYMTPSFLLSCAKTLVSFGFQEAAVKLGLQFNSFITMFPSFAENLEATSYFLRLSKNVNMEFHLKIAERVASQLDNSILLMEIAKLEFKNNNFESGYFFAHKLFHSSNKTFQYQAACWLFECYLLTGQFLKVKQLFEGFQLWSENYTRFLSHFVSQIKDDPLSTFWIEETESYFLKPFPDSFCISTKTKNLIFEVAEINIQVALQMGIQETEFRVIHLTPKWKSYNQFVEWMNDMLTLFEKAQAIEKWNSIFSKILLLPSIKRKKSLVKKLITLIEKKEQ